MKKILFIFTLLPFICLSQNIKCEDFKNGKFIMTSETMPGVQIALERYDDIQTEELINNSSSTNISINKIYEKVEWLSKCQYKLTFDLSKGELNEISKQINENGGIITNIIAIKNNCYTYESIFKINGKTQKITGEICKDLFN